MRALLALVLVATAFAGCMESQEGQADPKLLLGGREAQPVPDIPGNWAELVLAGGAEHNHRDHSHHVGRSTANFELLAYNPLVTDYFGTTAGGHSCGDTVEANGRRLTVVHSINNDVAFVIVDVTDARDPQKIGELAMENTQTYDVGITPDQKYVIAATTPLGVGPGNVAVPLSATFEDACTGETRPVLGPETSLPFQSGLVLVNIENPRNPIIEDFFVYPVLGGHSVRIAEIGGQTLLLTAVSNVPGYYAIAELQDVGGRGKLVPLSQYTMAMETPNAAPAEMQASGHDGFMATHPVTGEDLAYLAYGTNGLVILNIDDPAQPVFVSRWNDWDAVGGPHASHFFHGVKPMTELWDGVHYTFVQEECSGHPPKYPSCLAYAFDTTDPSNPRLVSAWSFPIDVEWTEAAQFSAHYLDVQNRTLFIAMYHAGLWAIDVSTPEAIAKLPSIGAFVPSNKSPKPPPTIGYGAPAVLDFQPLSDGNIVVFDRGAGLYTVRFDPTNPAPSPEPWPVMTATQG